MMPYPVRLSVALLGVSAVAVLVFASAAQYAYSEVRNRGYF